MASNVTSKGQVTIPKRIRDHLGIRAGSAVEFDLDEHGRIVLFKAKGKAQGKGTAKTLPKSRFARIVGTATVKMTTDEIMEMWRGKDWRGDD